MGWFSGKYDDETDASKANTVSDKEWRSIQTRAAKANQARGKVSSDEGRRGAQRGADNYNKRWWN